MKRIPTPKRVIMIKHQRRIQILRLSFLLLILFLSIVGALAYFSFNKNITITKVTVEGTNIINSSEVIFVVKSGLTGKYYNLFSRADSFIFPRKEIYNNLIKHFPRIEEVSIVKKNLNTLQINIKERLGSYLYCGNTIPDVLSKIGENCYFMNSDGYIFGKAPYFSGDVYFKYYLKINDDKSILGQNVMNLNHFHKLVRFINGITSLGFKPISLVIDTSGKEILYLNHNLDESTPEIIFQTSNNFDKILSNLSAAMNTTKFSNEITSRYNTLQYIDLRFNNKVLFKFIK